MAGSLPQNRGNRSSNRVGATVSRRLRAAGFNVSPAARRNRFDGLFVRAAGDYVSVLVDLGVPSENERLAHELINRLIGWGEIADGSIVTSLDPGGSASIRFTYGSNEGVA